MVSLALAASAIILLILLVGPLSYLFARIGCPRFIVYLFSGLSIVCGLWFMTIGIPIWYIGLFPIYCGYVSIKRVNKNDKP